MKKSKKILILILIIILLVAGVGCYFYFFRGNNTKSKNNSSKKDNTPVVDEVSENWFTKLNVRVITLFNEKFPLDHQFDINDGEELTFTLKDLRDLGVDVSEFNTDTIHCDEDSSKVVIRKSGEDFLRMSALDCTNDNEK